MRNMFLWQDPLYIETAMLILGFLFLILAIVFVSRNKNRHFTAAWASLKSWLFVGPLLLGAFGLPWPSPLICLALVGIYAVKKYFQMVGMFHRFWFLWACYLFIFLLAWCIESGHTELFSVSPMVFLGVISLVPLLRNSYKHMIQYMALSLMAFIFFGWSFMHLGRVFEFEKGVYIVLYIYMLSEFAENTHLAVTRFYGKHKLFTSISNRFCVEGFFFSILVTLLLAWGMRHLLPNRSEPYWFTAGIITSVAGQFGGLLMSTIRRDLGLKNTGLFIIGRGDIIDRMDKLIFVGPIFYYTYFHMIRAGV